MILFCTFISALVYAICLKEIKTKKDFTNKDQSYALSLRFFFIVQW